MASPFIEKPYDMVHVREGKKPNGIGCATAPLDPGSLFQPGLTSAPRLGAGSAPPVAAPRVVQNRADVKTSALIYEKLKEVLVDHGDGTWSYRDGWDDMNVAVAVLCNRKSVAYRRTKIFGPFPQAPAAPVGNTAARALDLVLNLYKLLGQDVPSE